MKSVTRRIATVVAVLAGVATSLAGTPAPASANGGGGHTVVRPVVRPVVHRPVPRPIARPFPGPFATWSFVDNYPNLRTCDQIGRIGLRRGAWRAYRCQYNWRWSDWDRGGRGGWDRGWDRGWGHGWWDWDNDWRRGGSGRWAPYDLLVLRNFRR